MACSGVTPARSRPVMRYHGLGNRPEPKPRLVCT
ncbi:hypothetical protein BJ969_003613 [Saccharopolyspora gloriosae]|uniref:Uncharacterized protein n=1 Tax=Saccharopolyspora gloriosae TaxID=455344 RepID=A0A840NKG9_9PSEU|nr:hypothetical protein [Saccharopolyspora gloriosae]